METIIYCEIHSIVQLYFKPNEIQSACESKGRYTRTALKIRKIYQWRSGVILQQAVAALWLRIPAYSHKLPPGSCKQSWPVASLTRIFTPLHLLGFQAPPLIGSLTSFYHSSLLSNCRILSTLIGLTTVFYFFPKQKSTYIHINVENLAFHRQHCRLTIYI